MHPMDNEGINDSNSELNREDPQVREIFQRKQEALMMQYGLKGSLYARVLELMIESQWLSTTEASMDADFLLSNWGNSLDSEKLSRLKNDKVPLQIPLEATLARMQLEMISSSEEVKQILVDEHIKKYVLGIYGNYYYEYNPEGPNTEIYLAGNYSLAHLRGATTKLSDTFKDAWGLNSNILIIPISMRIPRINNYSDVEDLTVKEISNIFMNVTNYSWLLTGDTLLTHDPEWVETEYQKLIQKINKEPLYAIEINKVLQYMLFERF